jgi:hypothetical protein
MLCTHFSSKNCETNFVVILMSRSMALKYCMLVLWYFSVEIYLILVIVVILENVNKL